MSPTLQHAVNAEQLAVWQLLFAARERADGRMSQDDLDGYAIRYAHAAHNRSIATKEQQ
jgi:hypothetical protein